MENSNLGVVEPDEMDFRRCLEICMPYLGPVAGEYTDWTPLHERDRLFPEDLDRNDPWQFKNVRVLWEVRIRAAARRQARLAHGESRWYSTDTLTCTPLP